MGRWRSGAPLVLAPDKDDPELGADPQRNNNFNYKEMDPLGYAVPLGSHMRRMNPRDTAANMNRRRMIRRGATYGPHLPEGAPDDGVERGIAAFVICASLIRQFEFAQNVWVNDRNFHELGNERDPIIGNQDGTLEFKIPKRPIRKTIKGLPAFTTVRGGAYFFLPGLKALRYLAGLESRDRLRSTQNNFRPTASDFGYVMWMNRTLTSSSSAPDRPGWCGRMRAADLGARTALVTRDEFGGMAANDGPVPVRTLGSRGAADSRGATARTIWHCGERAGARLSAAARARPRGRPRRACPFHVARTDRFAWACPCTNTPAIARFVDPQTIETETGLRLRAEKFILCTGGISRRLEVPGFEFTNTHSDAWSLTSVPASMLVIGGGATGAQVASVFNAFGSRVQLFHRGPRILPTEDEDISAAVASAFRSGIVVRENFGEIESFEKTPNGVRMNYPKDGDRNSAEASLAVVAVGWQANTAELNLAATGAKIDARGFVLVDPYPRTTAPHIFAAGDVTGRLLLVPPAIQDGFVAATNAVRGPTMTLDEAVNPIGSFTDPEYAQVGLTESQARGAR